MESPEGKIDRLMKIFQNCSIVTGNVELQFITQEDLKYAQDPQLSFLNQVEEVAGYVLVAHNQIQNISMPNLRVIWGDTKLTLPFDKEGSGKHALYVVNNAMQHLDLRNLRVVHDGSIVVKQNSYICHWETLDFRQILGDNWKERLFWSNNSYSCMPGMDVCSKECDRCWGPLPEQCQQIYRDNCAPQCSSGMCFDTNSPLYCCHPECAAGCSGPSDSECYGCKKMKNNGRCVDKCPAPELYDPITTQYVKNSEGKYAFHRECVTECPRHMVVYKDGCVSRCPPGYYIKDNESTCRPCHGTCPKTCIIEEPVTAANIQNFKGCTRVDGKIILRKDLFRGSSAVLPNFSFAPVAGIKEADLELLSNVRQVSQFVMIQVEELKNLSFLRNLEKIEGRRLFESKFALFITDCINLESFGTVSLKTISNGDVFLQNNQLCYIDQIPWNKIISSKNRVTFRNRNHLTCVSEEKVCDPVCEQGCWGPGSDMCYECKHWRLNKTCVKECSGDGVFQAGLKLCDFCHPECVSCSSTEPRNCSKCLHVRLEDECVRSCPKENYFENRQTRECQMCHQNCFSYGCTGPGNFVGVGGCKKCKYGVLNETTGLIDRCLKELSAGMPCSTFPDLQNYYWTVPSTPQIQSVIEHAVCKRCHPACSSCYSYGTSVTFNRCRCSRLAYKKSPDHTECVLNCPENTFLEEGNASEIQQCVQCHSECLGCNGTGSTNCFKCRTYVDYIGEHSFNCTAECPPERPFVNADNVCSDIDEVLLQKERQKRNQVVFGAVFGLLALITLIVGTAAWFYRRKVKLMHHMDELEVKFEINADAAPNLSRLNLIKEFELNKGNVLGYGAFGTVFRGVWVPEGRKMRIPVAIKVLHESNAVAEKEMLEEAGIMASMCDSYLVPLIGVCFSQQMMMVTPLMPLGNLLEYIQNNKSKIGSAALIRWCAQIAKGMSYLEEHRLVHRDLAARNVLVQNPYHVRITDFGLAKLLDYGQDEIKIYEGKMPIKWLALECIQYKRYTHKSDVWAFGVTAWELLTFCDKPYKDIPLHEIPARLQNGERLPQPRIATLEVYMLLIRCWMVDADARPTFKELHQSFVNMAKDPGRYLVIEGDALLKLPSFTPQDQRELIRKLVDDPEVMDPEDYFPSLASPSSPASPETPTKPLIGEVELRLANAANRHKSGTSLRYASDPLKKLANGHPEERVAAQMLATDVDNYLVPDSQQPQTKNETSSEDSVFFFYTPVTTAPSETESAVYYNQLPTTKTAGICVENVEYMKPFDKKVSSDAVNGELIQNETVV